MMHRVLLCIPTLGLMIVLGCGEDPIWGRTPAHRVMTTPHFVEITLGESTAVSARHLDSEGTPVLPLPVVRSLDTTIATVSVDSLRTGRPLPELYFFIRGQAVGQTAVVVAIEEGYLRDTCVVVVRSE